MSEKQFVCIDVGYGDDWYITDNGKRLSEIEIVDLLNEQQSTIEQLETELKCYKGIIEALERTRVIEVEIPTDKRMEEVR